MHQDRLTRRRFVVSVIALSGSALGPDIFPLGRTWAASASEIDESTRSEMVRMARLLYPHDALADDVYAGVLDRALSDVATGAQFAARLDAAADALDARAGGAWQQLDAAKQLEAMEAIGAESFFVAIQNQVRAGIYNGAAFWEHVGYPGPSTGFGGYIHRGAGDIDLSLIHI